MSQKNDADKILSDVLEQVSANVTKIKKAPGKDMSKEASALTTYGKFALECIKHAKDAKNQNPFEDVEITEEQEIEILEQELQRMKEKKKEEQE